MKTITRNSQWLSDVYQTPSGDPAWTSQTPIIEAKLKKIALDSSSTTSTLVTYEKVDLQTGDKLLIKSSTDPNYNQEIAVEGATTSTGLGTVEFDSDRSHIVAGNTPFYNYFNTGNFYQNIFGLNNWKFSDDGMRAWITSPETGIKNTLLQIELSVPFSLNSITSVSGSLLLLNQYGSGWGFANKGRYLFVSSDYGYADSSFNRYILSTPYDISTRHTKTAYYNSTIGNLNDYACSTFAFSEDGTKFMAIRYQNTYTFWGTCSKPFDLRTFVKTNSSADANMSGVVLTEDGKYGIKFNVGVNLQTGSLRFYDMSSGPAAYTASYTNYPFGNITGFSNSNLWEEDTSSGVYSPTFISNDLRYIGYIPASTGADSANTLNVFKTTLGTKTSIDVSTQGLTSVPENGYLYIQSKPKFKYAITDNLKSPAIKNDRLAMWSSTTNQAVVYSDKDALVNVGDTILLNNTDPVTVTSVSVANRPRISFTTGLTAARYVQNKTFSLSGVFGTTNPPNTPRFNFSKDGSKLFFVLSTKTGSADNLAGLYQYDLSTPWDISTAEPSAVPYISNQDLLHPDDLETHIAYNDGIYAPTSTLGSITDFAFSPDGRKVLFIYRAGFYYAYNSAYLELSRPYDLTSTRISSTLGTTYNSGNTNYFFQGFEFNLTGTQILLSYYNSGNAFLENVNQFAFSEEYRPIMTWTTSGIFGGNSGLYGTLRITPDGSEIVQFGSHTTTDNPFTHITRGMHITSLITNNTFQGQTSLSGQSPVNFDEGSVTASDRIVDHRFSRDGMRWYAMSESGILHQWDCMQKDGYQHTIQFAAQSSAPTSVWLPDNSVSATLVETSFTTDSVDHATAAVTYTTEQPITMSDTNYIRFKLDTPDGIPAEIDTIRVDLT